MKIYTTQLSPYGNRIYAWSAVKGVSLDFVPPPGGAGSDEFKKINPSGKIPVVVTNDGLIPESLIILNYLEDLYPEPPLRLANSELHARTLATVLMHDLYVVPELIPVFSQFAQPKLDNELIGRIFASFAQRLPLLTTTLPAGTGCAAGSELSLADCAMAPFFLLYELVAVNLGRPNPIRDQPRLADWSTNLLRHPVIRPVTTAMQEKFCAYLERFDRKQF
jgi:glutathione S-transferase